ncbi:uncharacterized protein LOC141567337 [Rhinolophus sinicus]|uniref:uncharacterized protein LOC141567337 n=1 Tax=Rhinolophus sinicus TaxID=89399 RepID=UPI003D7B6383
MAVASAAAPAHQSRPVASAAARGQRVGAASTRSRPRRRCRRRRRRRSHRLLTPPSRNTLAAPAPRRSSPRQRRHPNSTPQYYHHRPPRLAAARGRGQSKPSAHWPRYRARSWPPPPGEEVRGGGSCEGWARSCGSRTVTIPGLCRRRLFCACVCPPRQVQPLVKKRNLHGSSVKLSMNHAWAVEDRKLQTERDKCGPDTASWCQWHHGLLKNNGL